MDFGNTEEHYQYIKDAIYQAAYEALGLYEKNNNKRKPYWWDEKIERAIEKKGEEYMKKLLTENRPDFMEKTKHAQINIETVVSPIGLTTEENRKACNSLGNGKASGSGNIPAELLKVGTQKLLEHLRKLFQDCVNRADISQEWKYEIKSRQLAWCRHIQRMPESRIPIQVLRWKSTGKEKRGRPRRSWQEGIDKTIKERDLVERQRSMEIWHRKTIIFLPHQHLQVEESATWNDLEDDVLDQDVPAPRAVTDNDDETPNSSSSDKDRI
ncbi:hypothetical protein ILUMI_06125 [Ignelater luminosus]|uniref:Uncharacterized protein n=1 Tax=Ignelater luminosus TaxID=2038154 RepID=A0A8K0DBB1_IGNLU|nr:hypothetical protein ILUMI_06125 [Ignelater luminosus]